MSTNTDNSLGKINNNPETTIHLINDTETTPLTDPNANPTPPEFDLMTHVDDDEDEDCEDSDSSDTDTDSDDESRLLISSGLRHSITILSNPNSGPNSASDEAIFGRMIEELRRRYEERNTSERIGEKSLGEEEYMNVCNHYTLTQQLISSLLSRYGGLNNDQNITTTTTTTTTNPVGTTTRAHPTLSLTTLTSTLIPILSNLITTPVERLLQPNHVSHHTEITFQLFLRYLDQDLDVEIARGQFQSHSMRRALFSSLEDTFMPSYPQLSSAIHSFLERYSNVTPQRLAFNSPLYTGFGLYLQGRYMLPYVNDNRQNTVLGHDAVSQRERGEGVNREEFTNDVPTSNHLTSQKDCNNNDINQSPHHPTNSFTNNEQKWYLYKPQTAVLVQKDEVNQNYIQNGPNRPLMPHPNNTIIAAPDPNDLTPDDDGFSTSSDDDPGLIDNDEGIGQVEAYRRAVIRHARYKARLKRRRARYAQRLGLDGIDLNKDSVDEVIYTKSVIPGYKDNLVANDYEALLELIFEQYCNLFNQIKSLKTRIDRINGDVDQEQLGLLEEEEEEEDRKTQKALASFNLIQQSLLHQLFIVPYPLRPQVHLTMARESWLHSLHFTLTKIHYDNIMSVFRSHKFLHHFTHLGTISLLMGPNQHAAITARDERLKSGGWGYSDDLGLLDLTYVNCMARFWVQFADEGQLFGSQSTTSTSTTNTSLTPSHLENTSSNVDEQQRKKDKYKVLIDNGADLIEGVIQGVIGSLLNYSPLPKL